MVAYSFKRQFVEPIRAGTKCQTIRAHRKRHALPGEALQLYVGMRTKHCEKIISDPQCIAVDPIMIRIRDSASCDIILVGQLLNGSEREALAVADGFGSEEPGTALHRMWRFWRDTHGLGHFNGVLVKWRSP